MDTMRIWLGIAMVLSWLLGAVAQAGAAASSNGFTAGQETAFHDVDGRPRTLGEFDGKVLLINFWTSWCPPCIREMPALRRLRRSLSNEPFALLAVNVAEGRGIVQRFAVLEEDGIQLLRDVDGNIARQWGVAAYPTSVILDANGRRRATIVGETDWDSEARYAQLRALIQTTTARTAPSRVAPAACRPRK